jgi:hypothetical protein
MHGLLVHALQPATEPMQAAATCRGTRPCLVDCNMSASSNPRIVRVSKEMSKVLRHQPPEGAMDPQGWVDVPVLLGVLRSKPTYEELVAVVEENDKVSSLAAMHSPSPQSHPRLPMQQLPNTVTAASCRSGLCWTRNQCPPGYVQPKGTACTWRSLS